MRSYRRCALAVVIAVGVLAAALGAACTVSAEGQGASNAPGEGTAPPTAAVEVDELRQRAAAFWAARVEGDAKAQWELLEPRARGRVTPGEYAATRGAVKYLGYQVEDATIDGYFGTVKVRLLVQMLASPMAQQRRRIPPSGALVDDRWVRVGGVWYRRIDQDSDGELRPQ